MNQRTYVIAIDGDEQYRTESRHHAKVFYDMVDDTFQKDIDGLKKQLIQVESNGWDGKVLLEDIIHCPNKEDNDVEEEIEEPVRRGWHR